ncbi:unnamed protein product [Ectocarpus sp. 12 AP-2014]
MMFKVGLSPLLLLVQGGMGAEGGTWSGISGQGKSPSEIVEVPTRALQRPMWRMQV